MPAPIYYRGLTCAVTVNGQSINCGEWNCTRKVMTVDFRTGADAGAPNLAPGCFDFDGNFVGPVNGAVVNPFPTTILVPISLFPGDGASPISGTVVITQVKATTKTTDGFRFDCTFAGVGQFTGI